MPTPQKIKDALAHVHDHASFLQVLLADTLEWPIAEKISRVDDIAFAWSADEFRAQNLEKRQLEGSQLWQIQPLRTGQPWGIFLIEFARDQVYRTVLRQVLRGLVPNRRRAPDAPSWEHENLLFLCTTKDYRSFTFAHFRGAKAASARLAMFSWQTGTKHPRTVCEFNLPALRWPEDDGRDPARWLKSWAKAFDKEPLTKDFFKRFDKAVNAVQNDLETYQKLDSAQAYAKAQLLLERLVFLYFLQNRGWLDQKRDFLPEAFQPYRAHPKDFTFYQNFLERHFWTLAAPPPHGYRLDGIPFTQRRPVRRRRIRSRRNSQKT